MGGPRWDVSELGVSDWHEEGGGEVEAWALLEVDGDLLSLCLLGPVPSRALVNFHRIPAQH